MSFLNLTDGCNRMRASINFSTYVRVYMPALAHMHIRRMHPGEPS